MVSGESPFLMVMVWHWIHMRAQPTPGTVWSHLNIPLRITWSGVDLFFVLSGYLIATILISKRTASNYYSVFYIRRALRILPVYFALLFIYLFASHFEAISQLMSLKLSALWYFTQMQNIGMALSGQFPGNGLSLTWSLAIEEQFYLMLPLLIRITPVKRLPLVISGMIAGGILLRLYLLYAIPSRAVFACYVLLPCRWDPLLLGVLIAWARQERINLARFSALSAPLAVAVVLWMGISDKGVIMSEFTTRYGYTVLGMSYAVILVAILTNPGWRAAMTFAPLVYLGAISYGLYLFHETVNPLVFLLVRHSAPQMAHWQDAGTVVLSLAATVAAAAVSWRWFESYCVSFGHSFQYAGSTRRADANAVLSVS